MQPTKLILPQQQKPMKFFEFNDIVNNKLYTFKGDKEEFLILNITGLLAHTLVTDDHRDQILNALGTTDRKLVEDAPLLFLANVMLIGMAMKHNQASIEAFNLSKGRDRQVSFDDFGTMISLFDFKDKGLEVSVKSLFGMQSDASIPSASYLDELFDLS